ncbi:MAG: hypothetical protein GY903_17430 [Fuerstiella sp.]|nr:hypothetical protein [Fuerstiella sp.]
MEIQAGDAVTYFDAPAGVEFTGGLEVSGDINVGSNKSVYIAGVQGSYDIGAGSAQFKTNLTYDAILEGYTNVYLSPGALGGSGTYVEINDGTAGVLRDLKSRTVYATAQAITDTPLSVAGAVGQTADLATFGSGARVTAAEEFSNPGPGDNELFGSGAGSGLTTGTGNTFMGEDAANGVATGINNVVFGSTCSLYAGAGYHTIAGYLAGRQISSAALGNSLFGYKAGEGLTSGNYNSCFGYGAGGSAGSQYSVSVGISSRFTGSNQFVSGSNLYPITDLFFGKGVTNATPTAYTINGTGGSGTDIAGADVNIAGGIGTGTGAGGSVELKTAAAGSSGSTANTLTTRMKIDGEGAITFPGIPTSDPGVTGVLWSDSGTLKLSP